MRLLRTNVSLFVMACLCLALSACGKKAADKPSGDAAPGSSGVDEATQQSNIEKSKQFVDRVFNKGDVSAIDELVSPDFVEHDPSPGQEPGIAGFKKMVTQWRAAFPDQNTTIDDIFASGDKVVIRSTMSGTNSGPMMGTPATNKAVKVEGIDIIRIKDGKAVEHWGQMDLGAMMTQLGMMPPPGGGSGKGDGAAKTDGAANGGAAKSDGAAKADTAPKTDGAKGH
ncbi:MAG: ester cyclase [Bacteroidetes bacterium]|nr:ester cyclase [Bacteroidota bacterium]